VLGVADRKILHELTAALVDGDGAACLGVVERLARQGFDLVHITRDVLGHLRNLVVAKTCAAQAQDGGPTLREMLDLAAEEVRDVLALAARADADDLTRCFQGFSNAFDDIVQSNQPRMGLEMVLVRLARRPPLLPLDELLSRVSDLERRLGGAPPPGPAPHGGGGGGGRAPIAPTRPVSESSEPAARTHGALALTEPPRPRLAEAAPRLVPVSAPFPVPTPAPVAPAAPAVPAESMDAWRAVLERVRATRPALASVFEHAMPVEIGAARLVVGFEPHAGFAAARAGDPEAIEVLTREARAHFGAPTVVTIEAAASSTNGLRSVASVDAEQRAAELARARGAVQRHPLVEEAIRLFGARLQDVRLPSGDG
jgi:DNA polymerase III subunit gamma/tau